ICKKLFLFVYSIRNGTHKNLRRHFLQNGIKPRVHGNTGRIPCHAVSVEGIKDVVAFLENYAEDYAILLPGMIPRVRDYGKAKLLPSSVSQRMVYRQYADAGREHTLCESSFKRIWRKYVPHIYSIKPMTNLCWTCKKNSTAILRNAGCEIEHQSE
uniref:Uncharacterized protein n=1 Tax=Amphimedon queenslandica TaxID=400682 RepID=A0A1X7TID9_AMPQE